MCEQSGGGDGILMKQPVIALLAIMMLAFGCLPSGTSVVGGPWKYSEAKRIKSPDPAVEAVLMTGEAGAATSTGYYL